MTNRVRTIFAALLAIAALSGTAGAQTPSAPAGPIPSAALTPLGIGLEGINYPYPVQYLDLTLEGQSVRMAYMDVPPAAAANGKTVVLLHGKSFSGDYWAHTIATLTGQGYRAIAPDQIGFGKSSKPDIRYHFDILARNTKALLDGLGITRAAIVGHSFGGMLAVYFARNYPETTQVLALENPIGLEDYRSAIPPQQIETLIKTEMSQTPESFRAFMAAFFVGWPPVAQHYTEIFSRVLQSPEYPRWARASALTYDMIYNEPIRHEYRLLKMPVLLVIGQNDRSVFFRRYAAPEAIKPLGNWPALGRDALKDLPDGKLVEINDAGHVPHAEKPDEFDAALLAFLKANLP
ncbi:alpha/beta hydrolase (plasmid) [Bradyrhizobium sp. CB82]|uniref:alpha/beta fold hydrolase n=1 Tax=Bradyrhizobium sp. CB82 TaxID=3039159 RepID=UPI0024B0A0CD|nr:alpha/beta hydrolase [Bradyrhizobium sp. CB82]WFU45570.1 alpha/beta hydrolase [Bradyrhizobium sp. CB82]